MICNNCGKELPDDSLFCEFCGNKIDEQIIKQVEKSKKEKEKAYQKEEELRLKEEAKHYRQTKERKPIEKRKIIIYSVIVALLAFVIVFFAFFKGRSIDKTVDSYMTAYDEHYETKMLKLMFPKKSLKYVKSEKMDRDLIQESKKLINGDADELEIIKTEDIDDNFEEKISYFFGEDGLDIKYDDIQYVYLSTDKNTSDMKDSKKIIAYKVRNKWYIVPGLIEYIIKGEQSQDIASAQNIASAVNYALGNEEVYNFFTTEYCGIEISLNRDLDYLPDYVKNRIMEALETVPQIKCDEFGACDFAFNVWYDGTVEVFISSDTKIDEWRVYPNVKDDYYEGTKDSEGSGNITDDYTFAMLISSKSPILGYWSSENAGMYIGYSCSGGNEGFTVYLQSQDIPFDLGFEMINKKSGYVYNYPDNVLYFLHDDKTEFYMDVIDDNTIELTMRYRHSKNDDTIFKTYTFKKGEITKEIYETFEDTWIEATQYLDNLKLGYCDTCGCLHNKPNNNEENAYHSNKHITLYDGKTINNILFIGDMWDDNSEFIPYERECFSIENNKLNCVFFNNVGYSFGYVYFREGSDEAKYYDCINKYKMTVDGMPIENSYILFDVNNDDRLELFVRMGDGEVDFYSYKDGKVIKNGLLSLDEVYYTPDGKVIVLGGSSQTYEHIPLRQIYEFNASTGGYDNTHTFEIKIRDWDKFNKLTNYEDYEKNAEIMSYSVDGKKYGTYEEAEAVFSSYYDTGSKIAFPDKWYRTIDEAYENKDK